MLPIINSDHISSLESKLSAEAKAKRDAEARIQEIQHLKNVVADANRRLHDPIFSNESARAFYEGKRATVEALAKQYVTRQNAGVNRGRPDPIGLATEDAIAFFFGDLILQKLAVLAECATARDPDRPASVPQTERDKYAAEQRRIARDAADRLRLLESQQ